MKKLILILSGAIGLSFTAQAQLTINTGLDTASMTNLLEGLGVNIQNMTINCDANAYGQFSGYSEIPIGNGIVFSTGDALMMADSNMSTSTTSTWSYPGDADLDLLAGTYTYDACVLEFDAVPVGDTLYFNFAFGSEEYMEWVSAGFNDVFAIWISGNGFPGPTNIAVLPNDTVVSVVNVNAYTNPQYYIDNETIPGSYISFDGFTTNIGVEAVVVPGSTYHFKIAIADAMDAAVDSGVMLEAFSFRSFMEISGMEELELQTMIYPNPAMDFIKLQFNTAKADVYILNTVGEIVYQSSNFNSDDILDVSELKSGIYFVKTVAGNKTGYTPLMIVK
jgi:hypothetical protein